MAFYKKTKQKIDGKWYPTSVTVGKPVSTDEVARRLAVESTVSPADTYAVLKALGGVLADFMANGRTVKLEGLGTFYYTAVSTGNGVTAPEKVTAAQITGVRVRFIPEVRAASNHQITTRTLVSSNIFWEEWGGKDNGGSGGEGGEDPSAGDGDVAPDPAL